MLYITLPRIWLSGAVLKLHASNAAFSTMAFRVRKSHRDFPSDEHLHGISITIDVDAMLKTQQLVAADIILSSDYTRHQSRIRDGSVEIEYCLRLQPPGMDRLCAVRRQEGERLGQAEIWFQD